VGDVVPASLAPVLDEPLDPGALELEVKWRPHGIPAVGAMVRVTLPECGAPHAFPRDARVDARGLVTLERVPAGAVEIRGDRSGVLQLELHGGERVRSELWLDEGAEVRGRTIDAAGRPVAHAEVRVFREGERDAPVAIESDNRGQFTLPGYVQPMRLQARAKQRSPSRLVEPYAGADGRLECVLTLGERGTDLLGQVVDPRESPVAGASVCVEALDGGADAPRAIAITDDEGRFALIGLAPVPSRLMVLFPRLAPYEEETSLGFGARDERILRLKPAGRVGGTAHFEDGSVARGLVVRYGPARDFLSIEAVTGDDGAFVLRGVTPGRVKLTAHRTSFVVDVSESGTTRWNPIVAKPADWALQRRPRLLDGQR
jgi:hypothetical protein